MSPQKPDPNTPTMCPTEGATMTLKPCPFCGGTPERVDIEDGENAGGSCISCTVCMASGNVEFECKENFVSNWNRRAAVASPAPASEPIAVLAAARKAHMDALDAYNARVKLVRAERERGNHSMNVNAENRAMSHAQSAFIKAAQDIADAALSRPTKAEAE